MRACDNRLLVFLNSASDLLGVLVESENDLVSVLTHHKQLASVSAYKLTCMIVARAYHVDVSNENRGNDVCFIVFANIEEVLEADQRVFFLSIFHHNLIIIIY